MGKYTNMSKPPVAASKMNSDVSNNSRKLWIIIVTSVIGGIAVLGISWVFLKNINHLAENRESGEQQSNLPGAGETNKVLVIVVSVGILAAALQLFTSLGFLLLKEKDSKSHIFRFVIGQAIIQTILLICLVLVIVYKSLQPNNSYTISGNTLGQFSTPSNVSTGFWIVLSSNVAFHLSAILYLVHLVMKRNDEEQMEEMTSVVIHRRVASKIPSIRTKSKRHARLPSLN